MDKRQAQSESRSPQSQVRALTLLASPYLCIDGIILLLCLKQTQLLSVQTHSLSSVTWHIQIWLFLILKASTSVETNQPVLHSWLLVLSSNSEYGLTPWHRTKYIKECTFLFRVNIFPLCWRTSLCRAIFVTKHPITVQLLRCLTTQPHMLITLVLLSFNTPFTQTLPFWECAIQINSSLMDWTLVSERCLLNTTALSTLIPWLGGTPTGYNFHWLPR